MSPAQQQWAGAVGQSAECAGVPAIFAGSPLGRGSFCWSRWPWIIGIWRIASRRTGRNVASTLAPSRRALIASRWSSFAATCRGLAASVTGASRQTGLLDPRGKTEELQQVARRIEPAAGMGASAVGAALRLPAAACAKRCADQRSAGPCAGNSASCVSRRGMPYRWRCRGRWAAR